MYDHAIRAGILPSEFMGLSPGDVLVIASNHRERERAFLRNLAWLFYNSAALFAIGVNEPKKLPDIYHAFPGLFEVDIAQQDWRIMKERVEEYGKRKKQEKG